MISKKQLTIIAQAIILTSQIGISNAYGMAARLARRAAMPVARNVASRPVSLRTTQSLFATTRLLQVQPQKVTIFSQPKRHFSPAAVDEPGRVEWENIQFLTQEEQKPLPELTKLFGNEPLTLEAQEKFKELTTTQSGCKLLCLFYAIMDKKYTDYGYEQLNNPQNIISKTFSRLFTKNDAEAFPAIHRHFVTMTLEPGNFANLCKHERGAKLLHMLSWYEIALGRKSLRKNMEPTNLADAYSRLMNQQTLHDLTHNEYLWYVINENGKGQLVTTLINQSLQPQEIFLRLVDADNFIALVKSSIGFDFLHTLLRRTPEATIAHLKPFEAQFQEWVESQWTMKDGRDHNWILYETPSYRDPYFDPPYTTAQKLFQEKIWPGMYPDCEKTRRKKQYQRYQHYVNQAQETVSAEEKQRINAAWKFEQFTPSKKTLKALIAQVDKSALEFCGYPMSLEESSKRRRTVLKLIHPDTHPDLSAEEKALLEEFAKKVNNAFDMAA